MMLDPRTPVIVGVGQVANPTDRPDYRPRSAADLAAEAAAVAIADAGLSIPSISVDLIASIRTFADSVPFAAPFGKPDNFPRAVARRLGIDPPHAVLSPVGGHTPVSMLGVIGERILRGEVDTALLCGGEAIATERRLLSSEQSAPDWNEHDRGALEDLGADLESFVRPWQSLYGLRSPAMAYGLCENARRLNRRQTRADYERDMARLFAPFARIAAANPLAMGVRDTPEARDLLADDARNPLIADPYRRRLVASDRVNSGAAIMMTSWKIAQTLRLAPKRTIFVHALARADAPDVLERPDLASASEAVASIRAALSTAAVNIENARHLDFYSCFPIAVFATAIDGLGLDPDDCRGLTVTGGLPYFGGPGNSYALHALAELVERLRRNPSDYGLVFANGGYLSKFATTILSARAAEWPRVDRYSTKETRQVIDKAQGPFRLLSVTADYAGNRPRPAIVIGETSNGSRFAAIAKDESATEALLSDLPRQVSCHQSVDGRNEVVVS